MATKKITIEVEVPEGLEEVDEELLAGIARSAIERRLLLLKELEELIPEPIATEEEIKEIDKEIKRAIARRLEDETTENND
ncbi:MAG: hypothetical protein F7C81_03265 [Desulfurococcales archaeon]|nr:hypothetical protein [Desulfurococcales archaeon]